MGDRQILLFGLAVFAGLSISLPCKFFEGKNNLRCSLKRFAMQRIVHSPTFTIFIINSNLIQSFCKAESLLSFLFSFYRKKPREETKRKVKRKKEKAVDTTFFIV